jgi:hypothetical protein
VESKNIFIANKHQVVSVGRKKKGGFIEEPDI